MIRKQSRREWSDKMSDIQNERLIEFISNSKVAFINGQFQEAFTLAKEAIKLDENCADAYQCAANVCMSLGRYEDAIEYYQKAVNCDPNNGNRYFSLGYAQASVNKIAEAMQNFAKADELGLNEDAAGQMYHILGIVNQEFGKLDDALINLKKSELIIPADMDILKRKAVIYGLLDEITNGLQTANQMKLLSELKKSYKIIQADADTYISFRKLEEKGITLDDIHEFCNKVYATVNDGEYFTIHSIRSYGFTNIFENAGFGEYFCSALLACDSRFDSQSIFLSIVLSKSNEIGQISKKSFIKSCLSENAPCSPKKLIESVYNKYGVRITDKYEITEAIKNSNFCYDDIIDEIYAIE